MLLILERPPLSSVYLKATYSDRAGVGSSYLSKNFSNCVVGIRGVDFFVRVSKLVTITMKWMRTPTATRRAIDRKIGFFNSNAPPKLASDRLSSIYFLFLTQCDKVAFFFCCLSDGCSVQHWLAFWLRTLSLGTAAFFLERPASNKRSWLQIISR